MDSAAEDDPELQGERLRTWILEMAAGNQAAMGRLYDATSGLVHGLVLRILRDHASAEEVTLDVYAQAWRRAGTYDPERGRPTTWLLTMARSRAIDRLRGTQRERARESLDDHPGLVDPAEDPSAVSEADERSRRIRAALALLPAEQREAIDLAFFAGLTHIEVAERIGAPLGTVKTRIRTGMIRLRDVLRPLAES